MVKLETSTKSTACSECLVGVAGACGRQDVCIFVPRKRRSGQLIYNEGDPADRVWYVKSGTVVLLSSGSDEGAERARAVRFPGAFIGLEALVSDTHVESAQATSPVTVCGASKSDVAAWLGPPNSPARTALELTLRTNCSDVARQAPAKGNAVRRVATWLLAEGPRETTLALPRRYVADLLGMRAETLSRALSDLDERGALEVTRTTLRISSENLLREAAS